MQKVLGDYKVAQKLLDDLHFCNMFENLLPYRSGKYLRLFETVLGELDDNKCPRLTKKSTNSYKNAFCGNFALYQ